MGSNFLIIASSICTGMLLMTGFYVFSRDIKSRINQLFLAICVSITMWFSTFFIGYVLGPNTPLGYFWFRFEYCGVTFIVLFVFDYLIHLFDYKKFKIWAQLNYVYGLVISFLILNTPYIIDKDLYFYNWGGISKSRAFPSVLLILLFYYYHYGRMDTDINNIKP